jgi:hypothetical protein
VAANSGSGRNLSANNHVEELIALVADHRVALAERQGLNSRRRSLQAAMALTWYGVLLSGLILSRQI